MDPGAWGALGLAAGAVGGFLAAWLRYRTDSAEVEVHHDTAAFQGYDTLVAHYHAELVRSTDAELRLRQEVAELKQQHEECQQRLALTERDLEDLRGDLNVLKGLVVTQIQAESDREP